MQKAAAMKNPHHHGHCVAVTRKSTTAFRPFIANTEMNLLKILGKRENLFLGTNPCNYGIVSTYTILVLIARYCNDTKQGI